MFLRASPSRRLLSAEASRWHCRLLQVCFLLLAPFLVYPYGLALLFQRWRMFHIMSATAAHFTGMSLVKPHIGGLGRAVEAVQRRDSFAALRSSCYFSRPAYWRRFSAPVRDLGSRGESSELIWNRIFVRQASISYFGDVVSWGSPTALLSAADDDDDNGAPLGAVVVHVDTRGSSFLVWTEKVLPLIRRPFVLDVLLRHFEPAAFVSVRGW
jgi:hypothetical protein